MIFTRRDKKSNISFQLKMVKPTTLLPSKKIVEENKVVPHRDDMNWGRATWFLFHTMAEKIKDEYFLQKKHELCNHIFRICASLPCLMCQGHAVDYMKKINFDNIKTKTELKRMLYNFHNVVNKNKNYPEFSYSELDEKYKKGNLTAIINNFFVYMEKSRNRQMVSHTMYSNNLLSSFRIWLKENIQFFNT